MAGTTSPASTGSPLFADGERVLCFHGPLIYEGKVLKIEYRDKDKKFYCFIHYAGWNKSWDEFVPENRVLKYNDENIQIQRNHKSAHEGAIKASKRNTPKAESIKKKGSLAGESTSSSGGKSGTDSRSSTPISDNKGKKTSSLFGKNELEHEDDLMKKRKRENIEEEQVYLMKQEVCIQLPDQVKQYLVDDWDRICRQKQLVRLPAQPSVDSILEAYLATQPNSDGIVQEFCLGLKDYFNTMLSSQLLYRSEKGQLAEVFQEKRESEYSSVYGMAHLMRLLTKIGPCIAFTSLPIEGVDLLQISVDQFINHLLQNHDQYFSSTVYQNVSVNENLRRNCMISSQ